MQTLSAEAEKKLNELGFKVTHMPDGTVTIRDNTQPARDGLNRFLNEPAVKVVTVVYQGRSLPGGPMAVNHDGNYLRAFAGGGFHRLTPMPAGVASIVPPNTWRVVGDRMVDDEAYIPINNSWRSQAILARTASEMGFDLIRRFAVGGIATTGGSSAAQPLSLDGMAISGRLVLEADGFARLIDGRITNAFDQAGTALQRRRR
jgi:rhodanese-related sulfurtransferase